MKKNLMQVVGKKSVSLYAGGKRIALCAREDVEIAVKPRINIPQKPRPVSVKVMFDSIIQAKGRYDDL